jgi:hypothetical protein
MFKLGVMSFVRVDGIRCTDVTTVEDFLSTEAKTIRRPPNQRAIPDILSPETKSKV